MPDTCLVEWWDPNSARPPTLSHLSPPSLSCLSHPFCRGSRPCSHLISHCLFLGHKDVFLAQCLL